MRFKVPRFCFGIDIYDNDTKEQLVQVGYNASNTETIIMELEKIIMELRLIKRTK